MAQRTAIRAAGPAVDYDDGGYDYQDFWRGREYEHWAERRVLRRLLAAVRPSEWLADFGGGFGRNAVHYRDRFDHAVIVDLSVTNLRRAASLLAGEIEAGRIFLIRADLNRLPFIDGAVDVGLTVRVLHHLPVVDTALAEMGRAVGREWIVDVPIKHHALGWVRSAMRGRTAEMRDDAPMVTGTSESPFYNFQLHSIRRSLARAGFATSLAGSVNNFRRWDRIVPRAAQGPLRAVVYGAEIVVQRGGRGWWGPSQFVIAHRNTVAVRNLEAIPQAFSSDAPMGGLARRLVCPRCRTSLRWDAQSATCTECATTYPHRSGFWDFGT